MWLKGQVCSNWVCGEAEHGLHGQIREVTDPVGVDVQKKPNLRRLLIQLYRHNISNKSDKPTQS